MNCRYFGVCLAAVGLLTACAGKKSKAQNDKEDMYQVQFDKGLRALDAQDYDEAALIFDHLLVEKPGSEMDLVTLFDSGSAYFGMGKCQKASERYRQVVRSSAGKFGRIESEALFRLSLAYECLGQDVKTITALLDAKRRGKDLPTEVVDAEIPARLAAAYARVGNRDKAVEYFNVASRGLKVIVSRGYSPTQINLLASTLYLMGQLNPQQRRAEIEPVGFLQSLSMQQPYLLQSIEIHRPPWSQKAEDDLKLAYDNIWQFKIDNPQTRRDFYTRALQTINELKGIRGPKRDPVEDAIFAQIDQTERHLRVELAKGGYSTPLTPEAVKRSGLKRQGRLVDPSGQTTKDPALK